MLVIRLRENPQVTIANLLVKTLSHGLARDKQLLFVHSTSIIHFSSKMLHTTTLNKISVERLSNKQ
jgi:hypothetical protein